MSILARIAAAFAAGAALAAALPAPPAPALAAAAGAALLSALCAARPFRAEHVAVACSLVAGWCRAPLPPPGTVGLRAATPCTRIVSAEVLEPSSRVRDGSRAEILVDGAAGCEGRPAPPALLPARARLSLTILDPAAPPLWPGERILLRAAVKGLPDHANFGGARIRSAPEGRLSAVAESAGSVARASRIRGDPRRGLSAARARLSGFWSANVAAPVDGLARALVLGESAALDPGQRSRFRRTGTAHLLAVSGLHLSILTWLFFGALRLALLRVTPLARRWEVGRFAAAATVPVLVAFAALVGARPPVVRSCVMASSVLLARAAGRRGGAVEGVALAAAALLAFDPGDVADPGFQLSFAAVISFLLGSGAGRAGSPEEPAGLRAAAARAVKRLFFGSLAATSATTPIALFHFDQVSAVAIPCNMIAIPFVSAIVMPALFAVSAAALVAPRLAGPAAGPVEALLGGLDAALGAISGHPLAAFDGPGPLFALAVTACCAAGLALAARRTRPALVAWAASLALAAAAAAADAPPVPRGRLVVDVLDVGQGSAALVTLPDGSRMLVDAGGSAAGPDRFGEGHLVPVLRGLGVRRIDPLVLSHGDLDHFVGAPAALRAFGAGRVWIPGAGEEDGRPGRAGFGEVLAGARRAGAGISSAPEICGASTIAGVRVEVLHPCVGRGGPDPEQSVNDNSLVLRLAYGATSILLPGDLSRDGEARLLRAGPALRSDVLVLGHHGSDSSSGPAFLDAVRPSHAVASAGRDNRYGFPRPGVVSALSRRGIRLWRTDRGGGIRIVSDGARLSVSSARGR